MFRTVELLASTVTLRPYVFIFFACFLFLAITNIGWKRTILFTAVAYLVAFFCEWSSAVAGTGLPFGLYRYIDTTRDRELWIAGVPFMDSLSFTFLSYVSWELAVLCLGRVNISLRDAQVERDENRRNSIAVTLLGSFFMMYLDIVIDPVALRGDRWFLGKMYYYPEGGPYFGVTITNFVGWFGVFFVIVRLYIFLDRRVFSQKRSPGEAHGVINYRFKALGPVALYLGILGFNLFVAFWIGERVIGWVGVFIVMALAVLILTALSRNRIVGIN
jgi:putative membrane protein